VEERGRRTRLRVFDFVERGPEPLRVDAPRPERVVARPVQTVPEDRHLPVGEHTAESVADTVEHRAGVLGRHVDQRTVQVEQPEVVVEVRAGTAVGTARGVVVRRVVTLHRDLQ